MKKKGTRAIPDFSRHAPRLADAHGPAPAPDKAVAPHLAPRPVVKPHATSSKSGRRGQ
jgi:hypothetical protein